MMAEFADAYMRLSAFCEIMIDIFGTFEGRHPIPKGIGELLITIEGVTFGPTDDLAKLKVLQHLQAQWWPWSNSACHPRL